MQLANFMNQIQSIAVEEWQHRLGKRSNFGQLKSEIELDYLDHVEPFWFATENLTNLVYGTILPAVRACLPQARLSSADLIRGVLLYFARREAPPGSHLVLVGALRPLDMAFVDFAKNSARFVYCEHPAIRDEHHAGPGLVPAKKVPAILVPATGQLLFDATAATLGDYLPPGSISTLVFDLTDDTADQIRLLATLSPLLAAETALIAQGPSSGLHGLYSLLAEDGVARLWAQCVIEDLPRLYSTQRYLTNTLRQSAAGEPRATQSITFAYFELLDKAGLTPPTTNRAAVRPTAYRLDPPRAADSGPYRFVAREEIAEFAQTALSFAPARTIPVRAPLFVDEPENAAAIWCGQFGVTSQEWLYPPNMSCPALGCSVFDNLRIIGTEMLVSERGKLFTASQIPMTDAEFATFSSLFRSDARSVEGGLISARAATITERIKAPSVILANGGMPMHYHFLFDILPRLWFLGQETLAGFSVALPDTVRLYQIETLIKCYGIDRDRIEIYSAEGGACLFDRACAAPSLVSDWWAMPEMIAAPRSALRHAAPPRDAQFRDAKRLYVSRRDVADSRSLVNETELVERLTSMGFVEMFPSAFGYEEQMYLFQMAELVVGPFGSGMANMIFCAPGARIVFLQPDSTNWRNWAFIMGYLGLDYGYIFGESFRLRSRGHNTEWIIDVDAVARRISLLL